MALELNRTKGARSLLRRTPQKSEPADRFSTPDLNLPWKGHAPANSFNLTSPQWERETRLNRFLGLDFDAAFRPTLPRNVDSASSLHWCLEIQKHLKARAKLALKKLLY